MKRLRPLYFIVANTAILVLVLELGAHGAITLYRWVAPTLPMTRPTTQLAEVAKANYAHMPLADVDEMLRVTLSLRFQYAPWVGYRHRQTTSRFVNVDAYGIRANGPVPRDVTAIQGAVWFFGGSTTFGYGVADHETIPAQLEQVTRRPVVNFGVSDYYSAQENLLLTQYLRVGYRPAVALFLDGINEVCGPDLYQAEIALMFNKVQEGYDWAFGYPVTYAYAGIGRRLKRLIGAEAEGGRVDELTCVGDGTQNPLRTVHARLLAERDALCRLYQIECRTLVQPFAGLHGRHDDARWLPQGPRNMLSNLFLHLESNWRAAGATFVTDALDHYDRHAFIDEVHYSAAANQVIARRIANAVGTTLETATPDRDAPRTPIP